MARIINAFFKMNVSIKRMFKTMGFAILAIHLASCFYFLVAKLDGFDSGNSWIHSKDL